MEHEVPQAQEVMTDEEMAGMDSYPYSTSKYPAQSKKRRQKSTKKESTKKRKGQQSTGTQFKITQWMPDYVTLPPPRTENVIDGKDFKFKKVTFNIEIEVCEIYKNEYFEKKHTREPLLESVEGRDSPFYHKRRRPNANRRMKYISRKNSNPDKERYIHVRKTLRRMNLL